MGDAHTLTPRRGDVFLVNFDPTVGSEIQKTRPAVIIQNNIGNRYSPVTIVAALSSADTDALYPTEVAIKAGEGGLDRPSVALLNQLRTIDKQRLVRKMGSLSANAMRQVDAALLISLGLSAI